MTQEAAEAQIEALLRSCSSTGSTNRRDFTINWGCFYGWWFPPSHDFEGTCQAEATATRVLGHGSDEHSARPTSKSMRTSGTWRSMTTWMTHWMTHWYTIHCTMVGGLHLHCFFWKSGHSITGYHWISLVSLFIFTGEVQATNLASLVVVIVCWQRGDSCRIYGYPQVKPQFSSTPHRKDRPKIAGQNIFSISGLSSDDSIG